MPVRIVPRQRGRGLGNTGVDPLTTPRRGEGTIAGTTRIWDLVIGASVGEIQAVYHG
jgi:hypothetical protein